MWFEEMGVGATLTRGSLVMCQLGRAAGCPDVWLNVAPIRL